MKRLRRWSARADAWAEARMNRNPWGYSLIYATGFVGLMALVQRDRLESLWPVLAGGWVVIVLVGGLSRKYLTPKDKAPEIGRSLPPGAGAMDEDGRRHRQGLP